MDEATIVRRAIDAVPRAFPRAYRADDLAEPLPYVAMGDAANWLRDHATDVERARVPLRHRRAARRFWRLVEELLEERDDELVTLVQLECLGWEAERLDVQSRYFGPLTMEVHLELQHAEAAREERQRRRLEKARTRDARR